MLLVNYWVDKKTFVDFWFSDIKEMNSFYEDDTLWWENIVFLSDKNQSSDEFKDIYF